VCIYITRSCWWKFSKFNSIDSLHGPRVCIYVTRSWWWKFSKVNSIDSVHGILNSELTSEIFYQQHLVILLCKKNSFVYVSRDVPLCMYHENSFVYVSRDVQNSFVYVSREFLCVCIRIPLFSKVNCIVNLHGILKCELAFKNFYQQLLVILTRGNSQNSAVWRLYIQGGEDLQDPLSCRSSVAKEPLIIGLFCGKWPIKIRHPKRLLHPVEHSGASFSWWVMWHWVCSTSLM